MITYNYISQLNRENKKIGLKLQNLNNLHPSLYLVNFMKGGKNNK
jgi:hypothetical protein